MAGRPPASQDREQDLTVTLAGASLPTVTFDRATTRSRHRMTDIDIIAAAIHETWRALSRAEGWSMTPRLDCPFAELDDDAKDENRAAAERMGDVLAVAGLALSDDLSRAEAPLPDGIEAMAEAEHNAWMAHRKQSGWYWAETRDDAAKRHPAMVRYAQLPEREKDKDRNNVRHYPAFAARAGLRIVRAI